MIAALYYEPLWMFYRDDVVRPQFDELRYKRLAVGSLDSGVRAFMDPLLAANGISHFNTELVPLINLAALRALQEGQVNAAFLVGPAQSPAIWQTLRDPDLKTDESGARRMTRFQTLPQWTFPCRPMRIDTTALDPACFTATCRSSSPSTSHG